MTLIRLGGFAALLTFCSCYPYLPGAYDGLAVALSLVAQAVTVGALLFVPVGLLWLVHVLRERRRRAAGRPASLASRRYLLAAAAAYILVAAVAAMVAWATGGLAFGCGALAVGASLFHRSRLRVKVSLAAGHDPGLSAPLALAAVPLVACGLQVLIAAPLTESSRTRAIAASAPLIADIEQHRAREGRYPQSLNALWPDYKVSVIGIEQFHYTPHGDTYNLSFEQPLPLWTAVGSRELVVFNPVGRHLMLSHAAWHLTRSPASLADGQGWYAQRARPEPNWKTFRFD